MPRIRKKAPPAHSRPDLVKVLVKELGKELKKEVESSTPAAPTIYEEEQPHGRKLQVTVIWDEWAGVPLEERGAIILDAYRKARLASELRRITLVMGLTLEEAQRLRIEY